MLYASKAYLFLQIKGKFMLRILIPLLIIVWVLWRLFLKQKPHKDDPKDNHSYTQQTPKELEDHMIVCSKCQTYVSSKDAIYSGAVAYCSETCLKDKR
ncbi:prokaryotic metallothionein family protein [Helicobacter pylori]|nr:prokaryotic metallothionein family protein [Helicobacter pylori]NHB24071.1 prokaryotic metallothionein family protein [Helicobacter pylori]NHB36210.1 prokaryotic metallothionein family protein [Helicobacter pylori]NHB37508.1 prokaryotic metallothionein family protein [Helicobacter pylori]NHB47519.1 prokaryotic metallothionein family protein [Helicobacter pylori]